MIVLYTFAFRNVKLCKKISKVHSIFKWKSHWIQPPHQESFQDLIRMVCRKVKEMAVILHEQGTACITAPDTCKSWYGILNMYCIRFLRCPISFNVGRVWFSSCLLLVSTTRVHIARRRWPATYPVGTRHCVGCTVSGNQLTDPTGC